MGDRERASLTDKPLFDLGGLAVLIERVRAAGYEASHERNCNDNCNDADQGQVLGARTC